MTTRGNKWWTLATVSVATFMLLLDITVVNVALPAIRTDLDASFTDLQWVIDAYTLTLAALVLTAGSLADRLGRRRVFAIGLVVFSAASLLAGLAPDPTLLNVARAVQGVGGAILFAVSLALVAQEFPAGRERANAMAAYGATIGVAVAVGPLVGGGLTDWLGWESIFLLNVPIGAAALAVTYSKLRETRDPNASRIDWAGLVTFSGALFLLILGLLRGNEEGWGSALIVSLLAGAAVLLAAFVAFERKVREPMLPLGLFGRRSFTGVQLAAFAVSGSMFALFLYLTLYMQSILGHTPLEAGLRYLPITVTIFLVAPVAGALMSRVRVQVLLAAGLALSGIGLLLMSGVDAGSEWTSLLGGFLVAGAGVGLLNPVIADVAVSVVPKEQSGMAAGINDTFRQVGVAVGIAAWGALFLGRGSDRVAELAAGTPLAEGDGPRRLLEAVSSGAQAPAASDPVASIAREGFLAGLNQVLTLGAGLALAGAVLSLWLVRERDIEREPLDPEPEPGRDRLPALSSSPAANGCALAANDGRRKPRQPCGMSNSGTSSVHEMVFGFMAAKLVHAAADLGIADLLADGPRTSAELAGPTGAHAPSLRRLLRGLAGLGVVAQTDGDRFELTELGGPLQTDAPDSARALVTMLCGPETWRSWGELAPSVRTGESGFERAHGMTWVEFYERNPKQSANFNQAMAEHTRDAAPGILAAADLSRFRTIVDVGGGDGTLIAAALRAEPRLEGILFDLPSGLEAAAETLAAAGVADRCRLEIGDFFVSVPKGADAYLLKQVLHDWDDEEAVAILRSVREAMAPDARVLIVERVLPERAGAADVQPLLVDVLMLVVTGGRERTEDEFRGLLEQAGFELSGLSDPLPPFDYRVIEAKNRALAGLAPRPSGATLEGRPDSD